MAETSNKLTVCLLKPGIAAYEDAIEEGVEGEAIDGVGTFYAAPSLPHPPDWLAKFFKTKAPDLVHIVSASARGVLLTTATHDGSDYVFAIIFGHGRHLLRDDVVEERFGLKVVLNSVHQNSLRSIDKLNMGSYGKQSREQIGREGEAANFGIDIEQDLVRAVTGRSKVAAFGRMISGKDAFSTSAKYDIDDVKVFLAVCIERFLSDDYKVDFDWIDQLEDVRSAAKLAALNAALIAKIQAGDFDRIWMAPPDIVDWADVAGFKYAKPKRGALYDDLSMQALVESADGKAVTMDWLNGTSVYVVSAVDDEAHMHWSAYKCLYAEIVLDGSLHVLNGGKWYKVADDFTAVVNADFAAIPDTALLVPQYSHAKEGEYNEALAAHLPNSFCLDADLITYGGGKSSIEFCDLLTSDRKFVHVKRYSGSSQLSHLFSQGAVAAELFVSDQAFREKLNAKVPVHLRVANVVDRPDATQYEVVYAIISRSTKPLDVPFFSKVTVRSAVRRLRSFGYKVSKLKIEVAAGAAA